MKVIGNLTKDAIIRAAVSEGLTFTQAAGTPVDVDTVATTSAKIAFDSSNNKVVVAYTDQGNSYQGKAVVGTVDPSNNSISFGTPVVFYSGETGNDFFDITFDSNSNKIVIVYQDVTDSNEGMAVVGTVSGTSISFGTPGEFSPNNITMAKCTFDSSNNKVVVVFKNQSVSNYGYAAVGTVSGTSISFGSVVVFNSNNTSYPSPTFDTSNNKVVITYRNQSTTHATAIVGTVSGTSISFGSATAWHTSSSTYQSITFDSTNNKVIVVANQSGGYAAVGTVSGTSISFGSVVNFASGSAEYNAAAFDSNTGKVVIVYKQSSTDDPALIVGEVSGTSISFGTAITLQGTDNTNGNRGITFDSNAKKIVTVYMDSSDNRNEAVVFQTAGSIATGGTIADGKPVIVNANGTVSTISQTATSESLGSEVQYNAANSVYTSACYDSAAGKCAVFYRDSGSSNVGNYVVGTISDQSITYGSEANFESGQVQWTSAVFEPVAGKVVVAYQDQDNSFYGKVVVGTLSGTSITWGTPVTFNSNETTYIDVVYHTGEGKIVVVYKNSSNYGRAIAGTVSGNSISFGTGVDVDTSSGNYMSAVYHATAQKVVTSFKATSSIACCRVLTLSGTTITVGARQSFITTGQANQGAIAYDTTSETVVIAFRDEANTTYGSIVAGSVSGDTITYGSLLTFQSGSVDWLGIRGFASAGGVILAYDNNSTSPNTVLVKYFTISGTTITLVSTNTFYSGAIAGNRSYGFAEDTANDKMLLAINVDSVGRSKVYNPAFNTTNLTSENFVGFMDGAALDGTNGEILSSCSIARNQTSLTPGQTYFVTPAGALSLTAGSPSVTAGTAISSTEIIVKG